MSNFLSEFFVCQSRWWDRLADNPTTTGFIPILLAATALAISLYIWLIKKPFPPLPPGPRGLPLVGNLPFIEPNFHLYCTKLSETYGLILKLQLGRKVWVVVSSTSLAKQVLKDHDATFANRDPPIGALGTTYGGRDIAWAPNGPEWRKLRHIFVQDMMSKACLDASYEFRRQEVRKMVRDVYAKVGSAMDIGELTFITILNVITSMLWGGSLQGEDRSRVGVEFRRGVEDVIFLLGAPNVSDLFPALAWFDFQGIESKANKVLKWFDRIFESLIEGRKKNDRGGGENKKEGKESKDFLEILLELKQKGEGKSLLSMEQVKAVLVDIVVGGTHTSAATIEWAMTEMLQYPEIMRKACEELEEVVGKDNVVEESHLPKLHYLDAIIKEVFRFHPIVPFLLPRSPSSTQIIADYTIPKGSRVLVNMFALQRDPEAWESPMEFQPERFLRDAGKGDYRGSKSLNYLPFGGGRRICPGIPLAEKMLLYVLASMLHSFEWKLPEGTKLELVGKFGIVLQKKDPLIAVPTAKVSFPQHYY